ncbi:MAG: translation initiation factor IF-2 [Cytophagales bacterium]|nr:translation initiation factor IF-2 [Cytophagales bacterium]
MNKKETKTSGSWRISELARSFNVRHTRIIKYLKERGYQVDNNPNARVGKDEFHVLETEFSNSATEKQEADDLVLGSSLPTSQAQPEKNNKEVLRRKEKEIVIRNLSSDTPPTESGDPSSPSGPSSRSSFKIIRKISIDPKDHIRSKKGVATEGENSSDPSKSFDTRSETKSSTPRSQHGDLRGLVVKGQIKLPPEKPKVKDAPADPKPKKKRIRRKGSIAPPREGETNTSPSDFQKKRNSSPKTATPSGAKRKNKRGKKDKKDERSKEHSSPFSRLESATTSASRGKYRREKRDLARIKREKGDTDGDSSLLRITEYASVGDLAALLNVPVNDLISKCMEIGMMVSINQRLDKESVIVLAEEYGYQASFTSPVEEESLDDKQDEEEDTESRVPVVTVMGHVDHGKTSLLDYVRNTKVTDAEEGGITQHIGAYEVHTKEGRRIVFLDTPGHAAFTAMRARGAQITDVAILVIAADDHVRPQTEEAINHVKTANIPFVIAISKIDKPEAKAEIIREELSKRDILVEEWGGKYQSQTVSAKDGTGVDGLLEKVLVESDLLELKASSEKMAKGTVIEASLDKGRGFVSTVLVQNGTLKQGDILLVGRHFGKLRAMYDHTGKAIREAPPSTPVQVLGLNGAPQLGEQFRVMSSEREARILATKREQIAREQRARTQKHITLDDIGKRLAMESFQELNLIIKGDVDGSIEALSDSLLKLSTDEVQVNIIHKAVGAISESDILLASASKAIVMGFRVRPSGATRQLAEKEGVEIRSYSIIFQAIDDVKTAMEGLLAPKVEEILGGSSEVKEIFKISKVGVVAGCQISEGNTKLNHRVRLLREGVIVYQGEILCLKHFKEDVEEVKAGMEFGIRIKDFNDIKVGDTIESYLSKEVKRKISSIN